MATFKPLLVLKSSTLKSLAVSLGVNSTGTKSQLASQIVSACRETVPFFERPMLEEQPSCEGMSESGLDLMALGAEGGVGKRERDKRKDKRVLSIDMGIRNLAMCVLEVSDPGLKKAGTRKRKGKVTESLPKVLAWERVAVAKKPEMEEPSPAIPEESIAANKNKRPPSKRKVAEAPPPGGDLGVPSAEAISNDKIRSKKQKQLIESPLEGEKKILEQVVSSEQTKPKRRDRPRNGKRVVEVMEEPPPKKEKRDLEGEEKPLEEKGNEKMGKTELPPECEKRALEQEKICPSQTTPKSESRLKKSKPAEALEVLEEPRNGRGVLEKGGSPSGDEMAEVTGVMKISPEGEQRVIEEKEPPEEMALEVTEVTEVPHPSREQTVLKPEQSHSEEATIPGGKRRGRKAMETLPEEKERKDPKQEEISPSETTPRSKSRPRRKERVTEVTKAQPPEELVFPISVPGPDLAPDELPKKGGSAKKKPKKKVESFEPSVYALLANTFVRHILDRFSPLDAVLIERQRYRSGSAAAIQEWTVRVNMLEAMLHAVFCCLHGEKSPLAESVSPSRVTRFWVDRVGEKFLETQKKPDRRKKKEVLGEELGVEGVEMVIEREKTYRKTKLAKVSLVKEWLRSGGVVKVGKDAKGVAADFEPVKGRRKSKSVSGGKLDDLADCLLQGMAWIRWEENRRRFAEGKLIPEFIPYANSKS